MEEDEDSFRVSLDDVQEYWEGLIHESSPLMFTVSEEELDTGQQKGHQKCDANQVLNETSFKTSYLSAEGREDNPNNRTWQQCESYQISLSFVAPQQWTSQEWMTNNESPVKSSKSLINKARKIETSGDTFIVEGAEHIFTELDSVMTSLPKWVGHEHPVLESDTYDFLVDLGYPMSPSSHGMQACMPPPPEYTARKKERRDLLSLKREELDALCREKEEQKKDDTPNTRQKLFKCYACKLLITEECNCIPRQLRLYDCGEFVNGLNIIIEEIIALRRVCSTTESMEVIKKKLKGIKRTPKRCCNCKMAINLKQCKCLTILVRIPKDIFGNHVPETVMKEKLTLHCIERIGSMKRKAGKEKKPSCQKKESKNKNKRKSVNKKEM